MPKTKTDPFKPSAAGIVRLGTVRFFYDVDAIAAFEDAEDSSALEYAQQASMPRIGRLRAMVQAGGTTADGTPLGFAALCKKHGLLNVHAASVSALAAALEDLNLLAASGASGPPSGDEGAAGKE